MITEIYRRTLDGVAFFVDNETKSPVLMKERHPIASRVLVDTTLAENRDLSFAHSSLNEEGSTLSPCPMTAASMRRAPSSNSTTTMAKNTPPRPTALVVSHSPACSIYVLERIEEGLASHAYWKQTA